MQKARRHPSKGLRQLVSIGFQVSISLPARGSFHLSLTVLCAIGHTRIFSLGRWSALIHTGFHVTRATWVHKYRDLLILTTGLSPSLVMLPRHIRLLINFCNSAESLQTLVIMTRNT